MITWRYEISPLMLKKISLVWSAHSWNIFLLTPEIFFNTEIEVSYLCVQCNILFLIMLFFQGYQKWKLDKDFEVESKWG